MDTLLQTVDFGKGFSIKIMLKSTFVANDMNDVM